MTAALALAVVVVAWTQVGSSPLPPRHIGTRDDFPPVVRNLTWQAYCQLDSSSFLPKDPVCTKVSEQKWENLGIAQFGEENHVIHFKGTLLFRD